METSADPVPDSDLRQLIRDLAHERLETGRHFPEERLEMPLPHQAQTIFQGMLCVIAVLVCLYISQDIVLPVVLAFVLKLLLQPLVSLLERFRVPKPAGVLFALAVLLSVFVGLGMLLSSLAAQWVPSYAGEPIHDKPSGGHPLPDLLVLEWGVPGAILAVPVLTIIKIVCDRLRPLRAFGHLLEG
jgi:predicted PurR-regulated permease PerM